MADPRLSYRPDVEITNEDDVAHRRSLAVRANASLARNDARPMEVPLRLAEYTVATVPTVGDWVGGLIYVSDETGGATVAFSDGTNWRRVQDRAIIA